MWVSYQTKRMHRLISRDTVRLYHITTAGLEFTMLIIRGERTWHMVQIKFKARPMNFGVFFRINELKCQDSEYLSGSCESAVTNQDLKIAVNWPNYHQSRLSGLSMRLRIHQFKVDACGSISLPLKYILEIMSGKCIKIQRYLSRAFERKRLQLLTRKGIMRYQIFSYSNGTAVYNGLIV